ncbi:hypothetical protein BDQ94DRAFT_18958 [Aspergillus welwitschiae]|uniref:Uncharacterized protein n=1 Tax=Aspergillus welwitschiae TaxID=1341132 RepID=A0A3F3Q5D8_9EURO|nr:hypothetical protein BDQ94DRAFT_18958 [Aspergillus welwitschiae]RDH34383.1 hypothetical protein BDQ94DRAFT_18958 [Aspergillus welwitschiae]
MGFHCPLCVLVHLDMPVRWLKLHQRHHCHYRLIRHDGRPSITFCLAHPILWLVHHQTSCRHMPHSHRRISRFFFVARFIRAALRTLHTRGYC